MKKAGLLIYRPMNFFSILRRKILHDFHPTGRELRTKVQRCLLTFGSSVRLVSKGAALVPPTISSHAKISPVAMKLPAWLDQVVHGSFFTVPPHFQHRNEKRSELLFQEISNVKELPLI